MDEEKDEGEGADEDDEDDEDGEDGEDGEEGEDGENGEDVGEDGSEDGNNGDDGDNGDRGRADTGNGAELCRRCSSLSRAAEMARTKCACALLKYSKSLTPNPMCDNMVRTKRMTKVRASKTDARYLEGCRSGSSISVPCCAAANMLDFAIAPRLWSHRSYTERNCSSNNALHQRPIQTGIIAVASTRPKD